MAEQTPDTPAARDASAPPPARPNKLLEFWRTQIRPVLLIVVIFMALRSSVADWNDVPTGSMKPTILEGDRIYVNKLAYDLKVPFTTWRIARWSTPQRGDVVVFFSPKTGQRMVKRVVGLPGETISLQFNKLYIDGRSVEYKPLDKSISDPVAADKAHRYEFAAEVIDGRKHPVMAIPGAINAMRNFGPVPVPAGHYFLMGDNRDNSADSRYFGFVPMEKIVGRSPFVLVSLDPNDYYLPRWSRFFSSLP